ncbi:MAG: nucleoside recognition domain-containing protein [Pseudomonadota bacterium]
MAESVAREAKGHPLRFLIPALIGATIFLGPVITEEQQTVVFGLLSDSLKAALGAGINEALLLVAGVAALGALAVKLIAPQGAEDSLVTQVFRTAWPWILLRLLGFAIATGVYFEVGPELLRLPDTGITAVKDIGQNVLVIYVGGLLLMPLLTDYGLMEFAGTLCRPLFRRLFRLPGRAAIDSLTSIAAASGIAVLVTVSQYQRGYYTVREACTIVCNFSLVSIPFCLLVAKVAGIGHLFFGWFLAVLCACLACALILARIPPLARLPDRTVNDQPTPERETDSGLAAAWQAALERAGTGPGPAEYFRRALRNIAIYTCAVIPPSMAVATLTAILLFHSPVITTLTWPLAQLLTLAGVAETSNIANGMLIGFADQFMPALVAAQVDSEYWRFVLAGLAVGQIIFMSEFCILILRSPLPLNLLQLAWLFGLRTLLILPVLLLFARWLTG